MPGTVWGLIVELEVSPGFLSARKTELSDSCASVAAVWHSQ